MTDTEVDPQPVPIPGNPILAYMEGSFGGEDEVKGLFVIGLTHAHVISLMIDSGVVIPFAGVLEQARKLAVERGHEHPMDVDSIYLCVEKDAEALRGSLNELAGEAEQYRATLTGPERGGDEEALPRGAGEYGYL